MGKPDNSIQTEDRRSFDTGSISKYRNEIFGISILAIIFFHYSEDLFMAYTAGRVSMYPFHLFKQFVLYYYEYIYSIGVEIFVFLSGMGLYYSFSKNSNLCSFYKRRFKRILIPYIIVAAVFWSVKDFIFNGTGFLGVLEDISFYTFFKDGIRSIWFIGLILFLYIIFPVIYHALASERNRDRWFAAILLLSYLLPIMLWYISPRLYANIEIAATRVPVFIIGCYMGKLIKSHYRVNNIIIYTSIVSCMLLKYVEVHQQWPGCIDRYADGIFALGLVLLLAVLFDLLKRAKWLIAFFSITGAYSLELYMTHVTLRNLFKEFGYSTYMFHIYICVILFAVILAIVLNRLCRLISNRS